MHVDIVGLEGVVFSGDAQFVVLPTETGEIGVLPGHTHLSGKIKSGHLRINQTEKEPFSVFVSGGVFEVSPKQVVVMVDVFSQEAVGDQGKELVDLAKTISESRANRLDFASIHLDTDEVMVRAEAFYKMKKDLSR